MPSILSKIPSSSPAQLRFLRIAFKSSRQFYLDQPFLIHLAHILSGPAFTALEIIHFVVVNTFASPDVQIKKMIVDRVRCVFNSWHEKGTVRFTFMHDCIVHY